MPDTRRASIGYNNPENVVSKFCNNRITTSRYTAYNFIFLNLREQFRRLANFYFLVISILMILGWYAPWLFQSSINPWGTVGTLIFVLGVTMAKDASEDISRHNADRRENSSPVVALREGKQVQLEKRALVVGDYVIVKSKEQFPADLILMASSDSRGQCFVETSNIDGETNLKIRKVAPQLVEKGCNSIEGLPSTGSFECDKPNKNIDNFNATLAVSGLQLPISVSNFLLRGSVLRNTQWIVGLVVYTGEDSKIMKNRGHAPSKLSTIEHTVNRLIGVVFITHFLLVVLSVILNDFFAEQYPYEYLGDSQTFVLPNWLGLCCTFYILYSNFIPISLYVTMEMINLFQAKFIRYDIGMYYEEEDVSALCRNSTLCQELGQVEYIFSDKTGTLTRNLMEFKHASIGGSTFTLEQAKEAVKSENQQVIDFFRILSVCHTVVPDPEGVKSSYSGVMCPSYEAESPDESALVEAAAHVGIRFIDRTSNDSTVLEFGENLNEAKSRSYSVLAVNEFNSTRKRMSVLVKLSNGEFWLMCKGADNVMIELAAEGNHETVDAHLTEFAEQGLRTLVISQRKVDSAEADAWLTKYREAQLNLTNRSEAMAAVAAEIEQNMTVIGASAIEDKLQDDVPETLESLQQAGIKVWVLTGDKLETAVNIGFSCKLLNPTMRMVTISVDTEEEARRQLLRLENVVSISEDKRLMKRFRDKVRKFRQNVLKSSSKSGSSSLEGIDQDTVVNMPDSDAGLSELSPMEQVDHHLASADDGDDELPSSSDHLALVIDGRTLTFIMEDERLRKALLHVGRVCKAVLACRVSPAQKAEIVSLVKDGIPGRPVSLAIGDGANDVTMIQRAAIGIGISGREGRQAVNASDFAIGQFRFLKRLLLVHGRQNYRRMSKVILLCFYKNICLVLSLFIFSFYTLMTGTSPFDSWVYAGFNWFSGMPPLLLGIFDTDISSDLLLAVPAFYENGRKYMELNFSKILIWILRAIFHSILCTMIPVVLGFGGTLPDEFMSLIPLGLLSFTCVLFTVNFVVGLETMTWNATHFFFHPGSALLFFFTVLFLSLFVSYPSLFGVGQKVFVTGMYWLVGVMFVPISNVCLVLVGKHIRREFRPTLAEIGAEVDKGLSTIKPKDFAARMLEQPRRKMDANDIDAVIEGTYSREDMELTESKRVARAASSVNLAFS